MPEPQLNPGETLGPPMSPPAAPALNPGETLGPPSSAPASSDETTDPSKTGYLINDVGNKVIVPKDGESYADTMKRAAAHGRQVTPEQINKEISTMPGKAATVLAAAPLIGAAGAAALATPGDAAATLYRGGEGVLPSVFTHTADGVRAITAWAARNPVQAYLLYQVMKELLPGAKKFLGIAKAVPDGE